MGPKELIRLIQHAVGLTLGMAFFLLIAWDFPHAVGLAFGGLWCSANLWVWNGLLKELFYERRFWILFAYLQLKLVILFGIGIIIFNWIPFSLGAALCGFLIPFLLIIVESIYYQNRGYNSSRHPDSTILESSIPPG